MTGKVGLGWEGSGLLGGLLLALWNSPNVVKVIDHHYSM